MTLDNLVSIGGGVALSVVANSAGWLGSDAMGHGLSVFAWGILGGTGGWLGRVAVTAIVDRAKRKRKKNNNNDNNNLQ